LQHLGLGGLLQGLGGLVAVAAQLAAARQFFARQGAVLFAQFAGGRSVQIEALL
jgi:hypothetical protein